MLKKLKLTYAVDRQLVAHIMTLNYVLKPLAIVILLFSLSACLTLGKKEEVIAPAPIPAPKPVEPSHLPLQTVSTRDILFAQTALTKLGFKLGEIDGMWGPKSANAMRNFEKSRSLKSANGKLSELNLYTLSRATKVRKSELKKSRRKKKNRDALSNQIDKSTPLSDAPQLIIVNRPYTVMSKANPYSEVVLKLQPGTGVYVVGRQDGWYEIESLANQRGFINSR